MKTAGVKGDSGVVAIAEIHVGENTRTNFEKKQMEELTASVKAKGVLQPLLVRSGNGKGGYILIAGHRRLRAAKDAGLQDVPVRVLAVDEHEAREIQAIENLQRADLGPIEEARALQVLLTADGSDYEAVASRVGKGVGHVTRAVRLLELPKDFLDAIEDGRLTPAHGHAMLRTTATVWPELVKIALKRNEWDKKLPDLEAFREAVESRIERSLKTAPFPLDKQFGADLPLCGGCPYNSKSQGDMFGDAKDGICTSPDCYGQKTKLHKADLVAAAQKKFGTMKYLGEGAENWNHEVKGHPLIDPKKMAKQMEKTPEKFAWVMVRQESGKAPKPAVVCIDAKSVPGAPKSNNSADHVGETPEQKALREKEAFIEGRVRVALYRALLPKLIKKTIPLPQHADMVRQMVGQCYVRYLSDVLREFLGVKGHARMDDAPKIDKLKPEELNGLLMLTMLGETWERKDMEAMGLDYKAVVAQAQADAVKEFDALPKAARGETN